ncbi:MAG: OsmC family protein [Lewinellaceae bacterium]|nr:OsmC family protein [Lewinellaceae bacterium]
MVKATINDENYKTDIRAGAHHLVSDEPKSLGGQDLGFSPDDLLAASLASCTAITLKMYVSRKEWSVDNIAVEVDFKYDRENQVSSFFRNIKVNGSLNSIQLKRLESVANNCPISKVLASKIINKTTLL